MPSPTESLTFTLRSSIFDRPRQLTICSGYLEFDDNDRAGAPPTRFERSEIESLRYGAKAIRGSEFRIGRIYCIDIRSTSGQVIKLRLKSIYRIRLRQLESKYLEITTALYKYYFHDKVRQYIKLFEENKPFDILGVNIDAEGILFDDKVGRVSWDYLRTRRYWTYFTLFSDTDPGQYKAFEPLEHWNAGVLYGLIESILKIKFPKTIHHEKRS